MGIILSPAPILPPVSLGPLSLFKHKLAYCQFVTLEKFRQMGLTQTRNLEKKQKNKRRKFLMMIRILSFVFTSTKSAQCTVIVL